MTTESSEAEVAAFADKVFASLLGAFDTAAIHLGHRLGLYRNLADSGPSTSWELARTAIGVALAYPQATVVGYDVDLPSVEAARLNAADHGVGDRVEFVCVDASAGVEDEDFDFYRLHQGAG